MCIPHPSCLGDDARFMSYANTGVVVAKQHTDDKENDQSASVPARE